jgi:cadmium resistance protein CadD (predicted permease)
LEGTNVDGMIILKKILKKYDDMGLDTVDLWQGAMLGFFSV